MLQVIGVNPGGADSNGRPSVDIYLDMKPVEPARITVNFSAGGVQSAKITVQDPQHGDTYEFRVTDDYFGVGWSGTVHSSSSSRSLPFKFNLHGNGSGFQAAVSVLF